MFERRELRRETLTAANKKLRPTLRWKPHSPNFGLEAYSRHHAYLRSDAGHQR